MATRSMACLGRQQKGGCIGDNDKEDNAMGQAIITRRMRQGPRHQWMAQMRPDGINIIFNSSWLEEIRGEKEELDA